VRIRVKDNHFVRIDWEEDRKIIMCEICHASEFKHYNTEALGFVCGCCYETICESANKTAAVMKQ
jgi:hypothetical protein